MFEKATIRKNIHQQIVYEIASRILAGKIEPGATLPTEDLASAEMNVSRTAYREALKVLTAKGLVESRPKTGTRICPRKHWNLLDPELMSWSFGIGPAKAFVESLSEMRMIIEPAAAALAAERASEDEIALIHDAFERMKSCGFETPESIQADLDFHLAILNAAGNDLLASLGHLIKSALEKSFELTTDLPGAREISLPRHADVLQEIQSRQPEKASKAMHLLLTEAWSDLVLVL